MAVGGKALRILVVDDNVDAARMLAMMLEHDGHPPCPRWTAMSWRAACGHSLEPAAPCWWR
jgi:CheY-like chemotaxis protein